MTSKQASAIINLRNTKELEVIETYFVNVPKIKGKMAEKGYTISSMADSLNVNRNTLSAYLEGPARFPYSAISKMAELLCDTPEEAKEIFFAQELTQYERNEKEE